MVDMGISPNPNIAEIAALFGETSRAAILTSLLDGRLYTASDLAYRAGITPQTASFHLGKLAEGGLVSVEKHGRHRYYQLANGEVASLLESFLVISPQPEVKSLKQSAQMIMLQKARTCYDHLAGKLGVGITDSMLDSGYLKKDGKEFALTEAGVQFVINFGLDLESIKKKRRSLSHACLDWSERSYHLAGALGNQLMQHFFDLGWITPLPGIRAVKVTDQGKAGFKQYFNISL